MSQKSASMGLSVAGDRQRRDILDGEARDYFAHMPIFLIALTFMWIGGLEYVDYFSTVNQRLYDSLISLHCATVLFFCGVAILTAQSHVKIFRSAASVSLALSVYGLFYEPSSSVFSSSPAPFDAPFNMNGASAILSALTALGIILSRLGPRSRRIAHYQGVAIIVAAILSRLVPGWFDVHLYDTADVANIAAFVGILCGGAVVGLSHRFKPESIFADKPVAILCILGVFVSVFGWYVLAKQGQSAVRHRAQMVSERISNDLQRSVNDQVAMVARMGRRWDALEQTPPENFIQKELNSYLRDLRTLVYVAVLDPDYAVRWSAGTDPEARHWLQRYLSDSGSRRWLQGVHTSGVARFGPAEGLLSVKPWAIIATPLAGLAFPGWTIVAVQDVSMLIGQTFGPAVSSLLYFRIHQQNYLLHGADSLKGHFSHVGTSNIALHNDVTWTLSSWHAEPWIQAFPQLLPILVLLGGLLFTHFLASTQKLASALRYRSALLHHASLHDALTGLPNKKQLEGKLEALCGQAQTSDVAAWVALFDMNGVKLISDSMGHKISDMVVNQVGQRLVATIEKQGFVARMKGDEFVVIFTGVPSERVFELTCSVISALARPYYIDNMELRLTANAGLTVSHGHIASPMNLVREADLALARAKQRGHNTWSEYTADLSASVAERLALRTDLQKALDQGSLDLYYQYLVDGHTGRIVGAEALLRWPHPIRGYIPPSYFVPMAEETGQINPLTDWVLNRACRDISELRASNLADFPVMVNISPVHFQRSDFVDSIKTKLQAYALPGECLEIEITEGVLLVNAPDTITKLMELKELGIKISIDDFGTGYSSLNYMKNLPIDKIKIDRSFINEVISDRRDAAITKAIIALAHHLNLKVIAEGVETESQFWFLKRNFCDEFQGYLFARPMPFKDFLLRLQEGGSHVSLPVPYREKESDRTLLLLDDEENILRALTRLLRRDGYKILTARTSHEAFTLLATHKVQVVVSDQRMPEMTGTEFLSRVKDIYPSTVRLVLSGYTDLKSVTDAINRGAIYKFLTKPWDDDELRDIIAQAFNGVASQELKSSAQAKWQNANPEGLA